MTMRKLLIIFLSVFSAMNLYAEEPDENAYFPNGFKLKIDRATLGPTLCETWNHRDRDITFSHTLALGFGFQRNEHLYYGGGIELRQRLNDLDYTHLSLPIYAEARLSLSNRKVSPYVGLKVGAGICLKDHDSEGYELYQRADGKWFHRDFERQDKLKGLYLNPELGVRIRRVGVGFCFPLMEYVREMDVYDSQSKSTEKRKLRSMDMGVHLFLSFHINL